MRHVYVGWLITITWDDYQRRVLFTCSTMALNFTFGKHWSAHWQEALLLTQERSLKQVEQRS